MKQYDYLIVGSGLFGSTFACMAKRQGKKCLVIVKRLTSDDYKDKVDRKSVV